MEKKQSESSLKILGELLWDVIRFTPSLIYSIIAKKMGSKYHNASYEERRRIDIERIQSKPNFKIKLKEKIRLLKKNPENWFYVEDEYQETIEFIEVLLENYPEQITFIDVRFQNNPKIAVPTYRKIPEIFSHSYEVVRDNPLIVKSILIQNSYQYHFISDRLKKDKEFMFGVVCKNPLVYCCLEDIFKRDIDFMVEALKGNKLIYYSIPKDIREQYGKNREEMIESIENKYNISILRQY